MMVQKSEKTLEICKICGANSPHFATTKILQKYDVDYFQCSHCGFVQTEHPYWLNEAYSEAIAASDVGLVYRNINLQPFTSYLLFNYFNHEAKFLDYGAGYGLFVRLMRDQGFDFYWHDKFCHNLFAQGFELKEENNDYFELVTAFEIFEHLANPLIEIEKILKFSSNILFTTTLLPANNPKPNEWHYYVPHEGQHISIYTLASLKILAKRYGLNLYSNGNSLHLLTSKKLPDNLFDLLTTQGKTPNKVSLLEKDYRKIVNERTKSSVTQGNEPLKTLPPPEIQKPIIVVDGVFFQLYQTGIARVWRSLLQEWANTDFAQHILVLDRANTAPKIPGISYRTIPPYNYNNLDGDHKILQQICDEEGADLFISTYYTTPIDTPSVFMAYDMIPEVLGADLNNPMWREKHNGIKHASAYISISENTARDLARIFPDIALESITVAHCGVASYFSPASEVEINDFKTKYGITKPYFLLGCLGGYKNSILFFQAFAQLPNKNSFDIVATGAGSDRLDQWRNYTQGCILHSLQLSDQELRLAYAGALALVYPSKYEGFGMPVAEAMSCGCPVITTPNSSLTEVGGNSVLYVNDDDVKGMLEALYEVQKPEVTQSLIKAGLEQAKKFSWSKMATIISSTLTQTAEKLTNPAQIEKQLDLGLQNLQSGQLQQAEACFQQILGQQPENARAWHLSGVTAFQQGQSAIAIERLNHALKLKPDNPESYFYLGNAYRRQGQLGEAIAAYQRYLQLKPEDGVAYSNLGVFYIEQGQPQQALQCFQRAIALNPDDADAHNNLGLFYREQKQFEPAIACFKKVIDRKPDNLDAYNNLAFLYLALGQFNEARKCFHQLVQLKPDWAEAYCNLGQVYKEQGNLSQAIQCYQKALQLQPGFMAANHCLLFYLHGSDDYEPLQIYAEHRKWAERHADPLARAIQPHSNDRNPERRLRIGYVSGDFKTHSVAYFFEPLLAAHHHSDFEIICYANNGTADATTERLRQNADGWREIHTLTDEQIAELVRQDRIDILVDLSGHNQDNRLLVFARKPAPVQVSYIGYPDTTGLNTIDYRLVDAWTDPEGQSEHRSTEELVRLPHGFLCYQPTSDCPEISPSPARTKGEITFGSFNSLAKVSTELVICWSRLLKAVPNSRLLLKASYLSDPDTCNYVKERFRQQGIDANRLELVGRLSELNQHLALYSQVDIALDTFPYNGTTTTCEAMWMGVPVITLAGSAHVSRVGVSLLHSVGLEELIAQSADDYIQKAVELANNLERLQELRATLRARMQAAPLTNTNLIAQSVEDAYRTMWWNWCGDKVHST